MFINSLSKKQGNLLLNKDFSRLFSYGKGNLFIPTTSTPATPAKGFSNFADGLSNSIQLEYTASSDTVAIPQAIFHNGEGGTVAVDNDSGIASVSTHQSVGNTITVSYTYDEFVADRTYTIVDTVNPTFVSWSDGVSSDTVNVEYGSSYTLPNANFTDNERGDFTVSPNPTIINTNVLGANIVNYTGTDNAGNSTLKTRTYTIVSTTPPTFESWSNGADDTVYVEYGSSYTLHTAFFRDITIAGVIVVQPDPTSINTNVLGANIVNYTYTNPNTGLLATKQRTYTIVDNVNPTFVSWSDGVSSDTIDVEYGSTYTLPNANFTDNERGDFSVSPNPTIINTNVLGAVYTINYTGTDNDGNSTLKTRTYTIVDNVNPTFVSWSDGLVVDNVNVEYGSSYDLPTANFTDNERGDFTVSPNPTIINTNVLGAVYTINYTGTDNDGNSTLKTRTYTIVDTTPPTYTLNITTEALYAIGGSGEFTINFNFTDLTEQVYITITDSPFSVFVLDNQSVSSTSYTKTYNPSNDITKDYIIKVQDINGVFTEITRTVVFNDTTAPTFDLTTTSTNLTTTFNLTNINEPNCRIELLHSKEYQATLTTVITTDTGSNSTYQFSRTETEYGTYDYIVRIYDSADNSRDNYKQIVYSDAIKPVININGTDYNNGATATINLVQNGTEPVISVSDNSGEAITANASPTLDITSATTQVITYTATDSASNTTSVIITYNVVDAIKPVINIDGTDYNNGATATINLVQNGTEPVISVSDNSGEAITASPSPTLDITSSGTQVITYTATDSSSNSTSVIITYNVEPSGGGGYRYYKIEFDATYYSLKNNRMLEISLANETLTLTDGTIESYTPIGSIIYPATDFGGDAGRLALLYNVASDDFLEQVDIRADSANANRITIIYDMTTPKPITHLILGSTDDFTSGNQGFAKDVWIYGSDDNSSFNLLTTLTGVRDIYPRQNYKLYAYPLSITAITAIDNLALRATFEEGNIYEIYKIGMTVNNTFTLDETEQIEGVKSGKKLLSNHLRIEDFPYTDYTITFWLKSLILNDAQYGSVILGTSGYSLQNGWRLYFQYAEQFGNGPIGITYANQSGYITRNSTIKNGDIRDEWTFFAITKQQTTLKNPTQTTWKSTIITDAQIPNITSSGYNTLEFGGVNAVDNDYEKEPLYFDDIRVYDRTLTESEIDAVYGEVSAP